VPGSENWCQTGVVPFLDGRLVTETLIAFVMIALLGLVLRWTFARGHDSERAIWPPNQGGDPDDFGLLAPVAVVDTADEATRMRDVLLEAGIKTTTAAGPDGRYRVLVFSAELDHARRVGGWSA
jgi:hypothetical protein